MWVSVYFSLTAEVQAIEGFMDLLGGRLKVKPETGLGSAPKAALNYSLNICHQPLLLYCHLPTKPLPPLMTSTCCQSHHSAPVASVPELTSLPDLFNESGSVLTHKSSNLYPNSSIKEKIHITCYRSDPSSVPLLDTC